MKVEKIKIDSIPSVIWGEKSVKVFIAVHGSMSNKEDETIKILADNVTSKGYQLISFDLPEHGERKTDLSYLCKFQNCVEDLKKVMKYAKSNYSEISLWACSMGAYFSIQAYKDEAIKQCLFLSPVVDMKRIMDHMMLWGNITEKDLKEKLEIKTDFGQIMYWDDYSFNMENPIDNWNKNTCILYGDKDNMQDKGTIKKFADNFNCELDIIKDGEHYFHTEEQLNYYKKWLKRSVI